MDIGHFYRTKKRNIIDRSRKAEPEKRDVRRREREEGGPRRNYLVLSQIDGTEIALVPIWRSGAEIAVAPPPPARRRDDVPIAAALLDLAHAILLSHLFVQRLLQCNLQDSKSEKLLFIT